MWIAKPLHALSPAESAAWCQVLEGQADEAPLAQTLAWGRAIQAVSGQVFAVFSSEERAGGLVFSQKDGSVFECVNGPLLAWDDPRAAPRQLALFATAVSRLSPRFETLVLRPRWLHGQSGTRLPALPLESAALSRAATLKLPLTGRPEDRFAPRLRRTLRATDAADVETRWEELEPGRLVEFALAAQAFGRARGFTVPPIFWFRALTGTQNPSERLRFALVSARGPGTGCELLIALHAGEAHYLFGHEWREPGARAAVSPSAAAHRLAIRHAAELGLKRYDFNGFVETPAADDPYAGVCEFKAQFGAELVRYEVPELRISAG